MAKVQKRTLVNHDRYMRVLVGRLMGELVHREVINATQLAQIELETNDRLGNDPKIAKWQEDVFSIAMRFVSHA